MPFDVYILNCNYFPQQKILFKYLKELKTNYAPTVSISLVLLSLLQFQA